MSWFTTIRSFVLFAASLPLLSCERPLTAAANVCFNSSREIGAETLSFIHRSFEKAGWRFSTFHPETDASVFMTKADADGTWIQLGNNGDPSMVAGTIYSFDPDKSQAIAKVKKVREWFRQLDPPAPESGLRSSTCGPNRVPLGWVEWGRT